MFRRFAAPSRRISEPPSALVLRSGREGETHMLQPTGELSVTTIQPFEHELERVEATGPREIVVDLSELDAIDTCGVKALLHADRRARHHGHRLTIVRGPERVQSTFERTGLQSRLPFARADSAGPGV